MLDQSKAEKIFEKIKKFSSVDEIEVLFSSTDFSLTRFANNTIHQNVAEVNERRQSVSPLMARPRALRRTALTMKD